MSAIIIDLKDFRTRTPEQVVRVFYRLYSPESVEEQLWNVFRICAVNNERKTSELNLDTTAIALLFDHLIALADAIYKLRLGTTGRCVICGRSPTDADD